MSTNQKADELDLFLRTLGAVGKEENHWSKLIRTMQVEIDKLNADISTLSHEHTSMRARNERLEDENKAAQDTIARLMLEINRLNNEL